MIYPFLLALVNFCLQSINVRGPHITHTGMDSERSMINHLWEDSYVSQTKIILIGNFNIPLQHIQSAGVFFGNSSHRNSWPAGIDCDVASQATLSSASVQQNTLTSLLDMMVSMEPLAFLLLGIQIIWSGVSVSYSWGSHVFWQQPFSSSFGYSLVTQLAPLSAVKTLLEEKSASGHNLSLTCFEE